MAESVLVWGLKKGPVPTRAYFWHAVKKRLIPLWPGYFLTRPDEIFFGSERKIFGIFRGNFPNL